MSVAGPIAEAAERYVRGEPPSVSFEFFPPVSEDAEKRLWKTIERLAPLSPAFVSITYGAGGSTRERTHAAVSRILKETKLTPAAHLTCVGAARHDVDEVARRYADLGVRHIVALRGDPPEGAGAGYAPHPDGYAYASDLVAGLKNIGDFDITVSAYPERHPESADWDAEIDNLKRKVDAGAARAITQFFFDAECVLRFRDRVRAAGLDVPIIPGIMPISNVKSVLRMAALCGTTIPDWLTRLYDGLDEDPTTRGFVSAAVTGELCGRLLREGCQRFHFYTLNRAELTHATCRLLGVRADEAKVGATP